MLKWRRIAYGLGMLGGLLLVGCSGQGVPAATETATPLVVQEIVVLAAGEEPDTRHRAPVAASPLRLQVRSRGGQAGQAIAARLIYLADSSRSQTQTVALPGGQQPWPLQFTADAVTTAGRYLLELTVDGRLLYSQEVDVAPASEPGA